MTNQEAGRQKLHGPGLTDVRMMTVAHSNFRRELGLTPALVRAVSDGDQHRTSMLTEHTTQWLGYLHHHHSIEDDLLWDVLLARVPDELAPLVHVMQTQHEHVATLLDQAHVQLDRWSRTASRSDRDAAAAVLSELCAALFEHLNAEETHLLPIMARHITAAEWEEFTRQGMESIPKRMIILGFGMMLYEGDPEAIEIEIQKLPAPLRRILPPLGRLSYRRYARRIHGTPTPTRGIGTASHYPRSSA